MNLDAFISDVRTWLMIHHVTPKTVIICVLVAAVVVFVLLKFFRPPRT